MVKILHFSTHNENCGIGKYQEMFLEEMKDSEQVKGQFFTTSPNELRAMSEPEKKRVYESLREELRGYDILHVQHEFSFLHSPSLQAICEIAKDLGKKLVITIHTSPSFVDETPGLSGYGPRSVVRYIKMRHRRDVFNRLFTNPVQFADMVIVHNTVTKKALVERGVDEAKIQMITLPVPGIKSSEKSEMIAKKLDKQSKDILMVITGFMHRYKGVDHAIKALSYLPDNYKLVVAGGMHIDHDHKIYNELADLIIKLGLKDRVYITGYVASDDELNAIIRACDIAVYPYDKEYYSNISSASLNNGFANHKPVIAYPTQSFVELNSYADAMVLCGAFAYYELAREVERVDLATASEKSKQFALKHSYTNISREVEGLYLGLVKK